MAYNSKNIYDNYMRGTLLGFSLNLSMRISMSNLLVISLSAARRHRSDIFSSPSLFLNEVFTHFIVEKLLSASAEETGKLHLRSKSFMRLGLNAEFI